MKIVIVGAGFTGTQLAKRLINGKNDVVLIDNDETTVRHASNRLDCNVIQADGNNLDTLEEAGIENADALVCVTSNDEVNMITCSLVDSVYPNVLKIARVRNYAYYMNTSTATQKHATKLSNENRHLYGIDFMVHPDVEAAEAIVDRCDGIYLTTDNTVFSALPSLVSVFNKANKPIFSGDVTGAMEGGCFMASGFNYYKAGYATGELVVDILNGKKPAEIPVRFMTKPEDSDLLFDLDVAKACGITIPESYLNQASYIIENGKLIEK